MMKKLFGGGSGEDAEESSQDAPKPFSEELESTIPVRISHTFSRIFYIVKHHILNRVVLEVDCYAGGTVGRKPGAQNR